jgi:nucleoside-diphosphate-sugar epimerase
MKAIVTGSNGFIGHNLCWKLKELEWQVMGIDNLSSGLPENVVPGFEYFQVKVQDKPAIEELLRSFRPDVIFHLAAVPRVSFSVENPMDTAETNVMGTLSLLETMVNTGLNKTCRLVNSSSSAVYGGADLLPTPEEYPCDPKSPYALQKLQAEEWIRLFVDLYSLDAVSLRYFNVFGPHSLFGGAYSTVLSAWLYHLYVNPDYQPLLEGDGLQTRDFCYVDNVVQANIQAATRERSFRGEAFNIAQGEAHNLRECRDLLEEVAGRPLVVASRPPRVGDVRHSLADISAARRELNYEPSRDFLDQLRRTARWYENDYPANIAA